MATLTVGTGRQFATIAAALAAARDGDTVSVLGGTYVNDFGTIARKVTLVASGGPVTLLATRPLAVGTGILTVAADATIDGFIFAGATASDGQGAGLLYTGGALVIRNSLFVANQDGLLALADPNGTISIQASEFARNGNNDGFSHNISVGAVKSLTIQDSYIHEAIGGDEVKSRAKATAITNTRIEDLGANAAASLDLPNGGVVAIRGSVIEKGAASTSATVIRMGGDAPYAGSSLTVSNDTIVSDRPGAILVQNTTTAVATVTSNTLYGIASPSATGPASLSANTVATTRPAVSATPLVTPTLALPVEYGRAGAVAANGTILTVGAGGAYATLAAAVAAAHDGDTIRVAAGTYTGGAITITHRLIIEGSGGIARFIPTAAPANGLAQFVVAADVTFRNLEIADVAAPGGTAAAIRVQSGNFTLVNSDIHDNQAGIVADPGLANTVAVYDSEITRNGTADGRGANIDVAELGTLTLRNDWIHDAVAGPEIRSRADNTTLSGDRVTQTAGNGAAGLELPSGGLVTVSGTVFQKGALAQATPMVHVGGAPEYLGSSISLVGNTFIAAPLANTPFVAADPGVTGLAATGSVFVGSAQGTVQVQNGSNGTASVRTGLAASTLAPWAATGAPSPGPLTTTAPAAAPSSRGVMLLRVSEDAYRGDARFTLSIDGVQVGGTLTAIAPHGTGRTQTFTIAGNFAPGPHSVAVRYINDQQDDGPGNDRNLYVDGLTFNGEDARQAAALTANGTALLATGPISQTVPLVVSLSEQASDTDAQAFIAIDGRVLGGLQTVTAAHGQGRTQAMSFLVDLAPGPHSATITVLNAAPDRTLYVDSIDVAGQHFAAAAAALTAGASTFAFTVAPPSLGNTDLFLTAGAPQPLLPLF